LKRALVHARLRQQKHVDNVTRLACLRVLLARTDNTNNPNGTAHLRMRNPATTAHTTSSNSVRRLRRHPVLVEGCINRTRPIRCLTLLFE